MPGSRYCWKLSATCSILIIQSGSRWFCAIAQFETIVIILANEQLALPQSEGVEGGGRCGGCGVQREQYRLFWNSCKVVSIKLLLAFVIIALSCARFRQTPTSPFFLPFSSLLLLPLALYLPLSLSLIQFPPSFSRCSLILICGTSVLLAK